MSLQYYKDEEARWPGLTARLPRGSWAEVEAGIRRLALAHGLPLRGVVIRPTSGCRHSKAGACSITINMAYASWLLVAHEVAHTYVINKMSAGRRGHGWHNKVHRRITDRFAQWITAQGWAAGTLAHEMALAEIAEASAPAVRTAAEPPPIEARIAHRERQVKRLETKIRSLTTRLKRAQRSLAALIRSRDRRPPL